jgi:hypothetical protein
MLTAVAEAESDFKPLKRPLTFEAYPIVNNKSWFMTNTRQVVPR